MPEARVILALAAEAEDDFIWGELEDIIQTNMYSAGPLGVKFAYFGAEGARASRPLMSTRWSQDSDDMRALLNHARSNCVCGCYVDIGSILGEALKETKEGPIQAIIIIGDRFSGNREEALAHAQQLRAAGTRVFVFQESIQKLAHNNTFKTLAEATNGAYISYNPSVERLADRLPRFFEAVSHYAIGGVDALEALADQFASLLLEQIDRSR